MWNYFPLTLTLTLRMADVQPLMLYEFILFTTTTYGCLHVERINYSLSLLSHLYLTKTNAGSKLLIWSMLKQFGQVIRPSTDGTWANSFMGYLTTNYFCETSVDQSWNL